MDTVKNYNGKITIKEILEPLKLSVVNEGDLDTEITIASIYQIGYELIGFFEVGEELNKYIHIYRNKEQDRNWDISKSHIIFYENLED